MEITKMGFMGYTIDLTNPVAYIIRSPEGYIRYELGKANNTTQDCLETIRKDVKISREFKKV